MGKRTYDELLARIAELEADAVARSRAEDDLVAERNKLQSILEAMQIGVTIRDLDYTLNYQNDYSIRVLGDHTGEKCYCAFARRDSICEGCPVELALRDGKAHSSVRITRLESGEDTHWDNIANPYRDARGTIVGCLEINTNITDRVRAEQERLELEARVQQVQKLESLAVLAAGVAHDFNNLLMGVLTNAGLALAAAPRDREVQRRLEQIELAARRAAELSREMLAYSGKGTFEVARVDLNALVAEMDPLLRSSVPKRGCVQVELGEGVCDLWADATQLRQVLMNLVMNAAEAVAEVDGTVSVRTSCMLVSQAELASSYIDDNLPGGRYAELEVSDNGPGIPEGFRSRVFDPFFSTKRQGRGLGLPVVLGIVRGHRGAVRVTSVPNEGTTFRVLLPCSSTRQVAPQPTASVPKARAAALEPPGPRTVLVVEDEPMVRDVVRATLELGGYAVLDAQDGQHAIELLRRRAGEVDCVLLDLTMPGLSGEETLAALRAIQPDVPVVLTSGYCERDAASRFAGEPISGFVQKPYSPAELHRAVGAALSLRAVPRPRTR